MDRLIVGFTFSCLLLSSQVVMAVTVGGFTFDDNAYVDVLLGFSGDFNTSGGSLSDVLTDTDAGTFAFIRDDNIQGNYVNLGFEDNRLVNGVGADLVLFELASADSLGVSLTVGGATINYATLPTGEIAGGFDLNAVAINLDDFGVAFGSTLSNIIIDMDNVSTFQPALGLVAALNSTAVPVPAAVWLFGSGLLGLIGIARRKKAA